MFCGFGTESRNDVIQLPVDNLATRGPVENHVEVTDGLTLVEG